MGYADMLRVIIYIIVICVTYVESFYIIHLSYYTMFKYVSNQKVAKFADLFVFKLVTDYTEHMLIPGK